MRHWHFRFYMTDLLDELVTIDAVRAVNDVLSAQASAISLGQVQRLIDRWSAGASMLRGGGVMEQPFIRNGWEDWSRVGAI
jgi:hypothetical protein